MKWKIPKAMSRRSQDASTNGHSLLEQIATLTAENRRKPSAKREGRLVQIRNEAFAELDRTVPTEAPEMQRSMPDAARAYEIVNGIPETDVARLDASVIRAAFLESGCLLVRGLLSTERASQLAHGIDKAFDGRDAFIAGTDVSRTAPWFQPFTPTSDHATSGNEWNRHVKGGGSVWAVDSPRVMFELLDAFDEAGVPELVESYLGERPVFSMKKAVLRRVSAESGAAWHQDGAFLGDAIRTLNVWIALTRCGDEAPGMDIVHRRLEEIVPTGTEGALFDWAVSDKLIHELVGDDIARPIFDPGDALLFDHLCLHRTAAEPDMPKLRYATETWCFAPSTYPGKQIPIVV